MAKADDKSSTTDQIGLREKWRVLLDREREQRARLFETLPTGGKQHRVAVREWWGTVSEVLKGIQNVTDWDDLPYQLFEMLAGLAEYLAVGQIPVTIKHVGGKGRTAPGPGEISDIRWAVTYVRAVRDGRRSGAASRVAVVRRLYKLRDERTVRHGAEHTSRSRFQKRGLLSSLRSRVGRRRARRYRHECTNWAAPERRQQKSRSSGR